MEVEPDRILGRDRLPRDVACGAIEL
jgi:hypothetical protein